MKQRDYEIAKTLKRKLSEVVKLVDFRVFGSRVRGDEGEYSDMDVFLEVESLNRDIKEEILNTTWEIGFEHFMVISPLIFTRDEIEKSALKASPIVKSILKEGVSV